MKSKQLFIELLGWYGVVAILLAYALVSFEVIESKSYAYHLLNLTGALGIVVVSITKKAKQPAVLNVIWAVVAAGAIIGLILRP
jgi:hypothetical protein